MWTLHICNWAVLKCMYTERVLLIADLEHCLLQLMTSVNSPRTAYFSHQLRISYSLVTSRAHAFLHSYVKLYNCKHSVTITRSAFKNNVFQLRLISKSPWLRSPHYVRHNSSLLRFLWTLKLRRFIQYDLIRHSEACSNYNGGLKEPFGNCSNYPG